MSKLISFYDKIDSIHYINLENRIEKNIYINNLLKTHFSDKKIIRDDIIKSLKQFKNKEIEDNYYKYALYT